MQKPEELYKIFNNSGGEKEFDDIIDKAVLADVLLIGESHGDSVGHKLEERILKEIHKKLSPDRDIILSLEFFEKDVQVSIDEYLDDLITEKHFLKSTRAWPNYMKDYRPLVEYSKKNNIEVIAANPPRRYVNMVSRNGRDSLNKLSKTAKTWLPPLPYRESSEPYIAKIEELNKKILLKLKEKKKQVKTEKKSQHPKKMMKGSSKKPIIDHNAQSLWDAAMAWSVSEALNKEKSFVINISGSFHCENKLGIPEHLIAYRPEIKQVIVTIKPVEDLSKIPQIKNRKDDFIVYSVEKQGR